MKLHVYIHLATLKPLSDTVILSYLILSYIYIYIYVYIHYPTSNPIYTLRVSTWASSKPLSQPRPQQRVPGVADVVLTEGEQDGGDTGAGYTHTGIRGARKRERDGEQWEGGSTFSAVLVESASSFSARRAKSFRGEAGEAGCPRRHRASPAGLPPATGSRWESGRASGERRAARWRIRERRGTRQGRGGSAAPHGQHPHGREPRQAGREGRGAGGADVVRTAEEYVRESDEERTGPGVMY
jgi:hypothetical protein